MKFIVTTLTQPLVKFGVQDAEGLGPKKRSKEGQPNKFCYSSDEEEVRRR
jgi:hypothetical protein